MTTTPTRIAVSLHPEIFYALQLLSDDESRIHRGWKSLAQTRLPRRWQTISIPSGMWPGVADIVDIAPTRNFSKLRKAFESVPSRQLQERMLMGLLHSKAAAIRLLDEDADIRRVISSLPRTKRDWLAYIGLYPLEPAARTVLDVLIRDPEQFRAGILRTLQFFWDSIFSETWQQLEPGLARSVARMKRLHKTSSFAGFMRHTLLPIECDDKKKALRAIRGGDVTPLSDISMCTFTPSAFNDGRFWTISMSDPGSLWFPYFTPGIKLGAETEASDIVGLKPDVALIFRALGDATRFALASLVGRKPQSAAELATALSVSKPTISHHIHILRSAGLIDETSHGGSVLISLREPVLEQLSTLAVNKFFESSEPLEISTSRKQS